MRAAKILAAVIAAIVLDSSPGSSWNSPPPKVQTVQACQPVPAISLLASSGAAGIVLVSSGRCH